MCGIRMPFSFAETLFDKTRIGMRVIISPNDAVPVEFSHAALFVPNAEVLAAAPARAESLEGEAAEAAMLADETKKAAAKYAREAASLTVSLQSRMAFGCSHARRHNPAGGHRASRYRSR